MKKIPFSILLVFLFGCEDTTQNPGDSPGLQVSLGACVSRDAAPKIRVDTTIMGKSFFKSRDSIHFSIETVLNCAAEYRFSASVIAPDTLAMEAVDVGDTRARCSCEKELSAGYRAMNGEDFSKIRFVKLSSRVYRLQEE